MNEVLTINIIANAAWGPFLSGSDNIFIECARRWAKMGHTINIFVWEEGLEMCRRNNLSRVNYIVWPAASFKRFGFPILYFARIVIGCVKAWRYNLKPQGIVYSASDFWPDVLPAFIMKVKNKKLKWVAGFFLSAPYPWQKDSPYKGWNFLKGVFYWLLQLPVYQIIKRYADNVLVTSEPDIKKFISSKRPADKVIVVLGGVNIAPSEQYFKSGKVLAPEVRKYDACFVGRFHFQKGVLELIDIWKLLYKMRPYSKLAMVGSGPLDDEVRQKIRKSHLEKNIELLGFRDGPEKYEIFKQSKIVVHPATYDSGGMAAAGAMAWGLPGVSFDLESLRTYYPRGMVKVALGDYKQFAEEINRLLSDGEHYARQSEEARRLIADEWDWDKRANFIINKIITN